MLSGIQTAMSPIEGAQFNIMALQPFFFFLSEIIRQNSTLWLVPELLAGSHIIFYTGIVEN
jgi:hypothetical protein